MKEIILLKEGEIALKGLNKRNFEEAFIKNLRHRLKPLGKFIYTRSQSMIYCEPADDTIDMDEAVSRASKVFGAAAICRAMITEKDFDIITRDVMPPLRAQRPLNMNTLCLHSSPLSRTAPLRDCSLF